MIDDIAPNRENYHHRLMDYNNDPTTTFADIQKFFRLLEDRITKRLEKTSRVISKLQSIAIDWCLNNVWSSTAVSVTNPTLAPQAASSDSSRKKRSVG